MEDTKGAEDMSKCEAALFLTGCGAALDVRFAHSDGAPPVPLPARRTQFYAALFQLADLWVDSVSTVEYTRCGAQSTFWQRCPRIPPAPRNLTGSSHIAAGWANTGS